MASSGLLLFENMKRVLLPGPRPHQSSGAGSPPLTCWPFSWFSPGQIWLSEIWAHLAGSCWGSCPPTPPSSSPNGCSQCILCPACACAWDCPNPGALGLVEPHEVFTVPSLKAVQVPLDDIPSLQDVSCTTQLSVGGKLAGVALNPLSVLPTKMLKRAHWRVIAHSLQSKPYQGKSLAPFLKV